MANENKDIGEIVKKCKILLLDIEGTTTSISFVKDTLFPYAEENVKQFLETEWGTDEVKDVVAALRKLALEDKENSVDGVVAIPGEDASKEDQIEGLVNNVKWQMSADRKASPLKQLQGMIWQQGYDKGDIKGHVYEDVSAALEQWRSVDEQKVYIYSSGSVQAQKLLFGQSLAGDLLKFIDGHFDTAVGSKQEGTSYTSIVEKIGVKPENVLFLTDILKEAEAARTAGLYVALVSREGNAPLPAEATEAYAILHSLAQLTVSNKRKTETQDEQPTKVPKTDTDDDVKTTSEPAISDKADAVKEVRDEQEKMEVEEASADVHNADDHKKVEENNVNAKTVIEDVTDTVVPVDVPMMDVEPVITEVEDEKSNTQDNTESMESEVTEKKNDAVTKEDVENTQAADIATKSDEIASKPDENSNASEVLSPNEPKESVELKPSENTEAKSNDEDKKVESSKEPEKDEIETQVIKKKAEVAEETPSTVIAEVEELSDENLGDVAEMMEDLVPVVEEPNEDMEELQNVGEVLEKECDEILSKVQEVTNLDNIPLKPLLNPIAEETMETELDENMDSNDIVDRILDTELDLELKQCSEIDLNSVSEMTNDEANEEQTVQNKTIEHNSDLGMSSKSEENVIENDKEASKALEINITEGGQKDDKGEVENDNKDKVENNSNVDNDDKVENNDSAECSNKIENKDKEENKGDIVMDDKIENLENLDNIDNSEVNDNLESKDIIQNTEKVESNDQNETKDKEVETQVSKAEDSKDKLADTTKNETKGQVESTDTEMVTDKTGADSEKDKESPVNGKDTNGDTVTVNVNGDASKTEELNSRLSAENGKQTVNGSNGDSDDAAKGGDEMEADDSEIKVKTVATDEPPTDPIEQPTKA